MTFFTSELFLSVVSPSSVEWESEKTTKKKDRKKHMRKEGIKIIRIKLESSKIGWIISWNHDESAELWKYNHTNKKGTT